jgi:MFS family permease
LPYFTFLFSNLRFLGFGFLIAVSSTFGQTFYIAMYGAELRSTFSLSHGEFGAVYAAGTLASGLLIIVIGNLIDRIDLRLYAPGLGIAMAGACYLLGTAQSVTMLIIAIFFLRICGQGLMSQAATVSMARYFDASTRGRAVSLAALGFPTGQALLPAMAVVAMAALPWREVWTTSALVTLLILPLSMLWLLRGHGERHTELLGRLGNIDSAAARRTGAADWTRGQVVRDRRFLVAMIAMLAPSFIITGLNFHQVHLAESKGWPLGLYASSFALYAGCQVASAVLTGIAVDRYGSVRLVPYYLIPLGIAALVIASYSSPLALALFMMLGGISGGAGSTLVATIWAELYGVRHLGGIKAMVAGLSVISSALAPAIFGVFIDENISIDTLAGLSGIYALMGAGLLMVVFRHNGRRPPPAAAS